MNEEEEQNENQQPDLGEQIVQGTKNQVTGLAKKEGKKLANAGAKKAAAGAKAGAKQLGAEIGKAFAALPLPAKIAVIIVIAVLVVIAIVLLGASDNYLDEENVKTMDEVTYQTVKEYCTIDETGIHIDKEELLKNLIIRLTENNIDLNELGLGDDGSYKVIGNNTVDSNSIIEYFDPNSQAAQYLYKFVSASLAGEFPYIEGSDEEAQGIIKIKRRKEETKEAKELTFIGYQKFSEMLETTSDAQKEEIMDYFSLDEDWNLCIAKPYKKTVNTYSHGELRNSVGEYTISEVKIPYRTMVAQYTVPFLFLIDLQIITHNANYVEAVAELMTKQSQIEFTIFDQIITNTNIYNYKAIRHGWELKDVGIQGDTVTGVSHREWSYTESDLDETTETIIETDNVKATVTKAKTWVIAQQTNYEMQVTKEYPYGESGTTNELPDQSDPGGHGSWDTDRTEYLYTEIIKREWVKAGDTKTIVTPSEFMGLWANETGTYVKGAPYRAVGDGKVGKVVKFRRLNSTTEGDPVVVNIAGSELELYELLESSVTTQVHAELIKEMIRVYKESEELTTYTFYTAAFTSMYEPFEFVEGSYVGNFDVHDESLFIKDVETLKKALAGGYSYSDELVKNAEAFLDMQDKYKVNAIFAAAVSITETSGGRYGHAVDGCKNWFNITGTNGPYKTTTSPKGTVYHWRIYETIGDGINAFGSNIAEGSYYYTQLKYTVGDIGQVYCPNTAEHPTQADDWIEATLAQMSRFYEAVGIDISPIIEGMEGSDYGYDIPGEALSDPQFAAMFEEAKKYLGTPYVWGGSSPQTGFDCSGFVSWVINQSGVGDVGRSTANGLRKYCAYVPKDEAQPGDLIFFEKTYATSGASHVGIYVGDGKMIHCGDPISITSIETSYWQSHFLDFGRIQ